MPSTTTLIIQDPRDAASFKSICDLSIGAHEGALALAKYFEAVAGGVYPSSITANVGATSATGTMTVTATGSVAAETCVVAGVTFTAVASGATGNQFNISATPTNQATNMVNAFNGSPGLAGIVTASNVAGVVTITAVVPGVSGNAIIISDALTNVATVAMAGGTAGTTYTIDLD